MLNGALANLDLILNERFQRLEQLASKVPTLGKKVAEISKSWKKPLDTIANASLMSAVEASDKSDYLTAIQNLSESARAGAAAWLQSIVDETAALAE